MRTEEPEVIHEAGSARSNSTQLCIRCDAVLVDNRSSTRLIAPYYRPGVTVVSFGGTTWITLREPTCRS